MYRRTNNRRQHFQPSLLSPPPVVNSSSLIEATYANFLIPFVVFVLKKIFNGSDTFHFSLFPSYVYLKTNTNMKLRLSATRQSSSLGSKTSPLRHSNIMCTNDHRSLNTISDDGIKIIQGFRTPERLSVILRFHDSRHPPSTSLPLL